MATQQQRRARTRQKILDAAAVLFKSYGFEKTSIMQIVEHADVVKGTFYQHFESKTDLLIALSRKEGSERVLGLIEKVHQGLSPCDALQRYYSVLAQWFEDNAPIALDVILLAIRQHDAKAEKPQQSAHAFTVAMLRLAQERGEIRRDIDALELAFVLGGAFTLAVINWSRDAQKALLQTYTRNCLTVFFKGAAL